MAIRPSAAVDVARLIKALSSPETAARETAIARLSVIGARAVSKLIASAADRTAAPLARVAALTALDAIAAPRALETALLLTADPDERVATAALRVLGTLARGAEPLATEAFEHLATRALDRRASAARRIAALDAIGTLPVALSGRIVATLRDDANEAVRLHVARQRAGAAAPIDGLLDRGLPADPLAVEAAVREDRATTDVATLRQLIDRLRERERTAPPGEAAQWTSVRGLVHQQLAARRSRIALFDLRETLEHARDPLPMSFLSAAGAVGDASCLEALAAAWVHAATQAASKDQWWRGQLAEAFRAIVTREQLTRRHAALKKILERWPSAGVLVASAPPSRPRRR